MRKAQKRQAEELAVQMEEAHRQVRRYIEQGDAGSAMGLLEDCQGAGMAIGELVEGTEGGGHPAVAALEEYCELVYRVHEGLAEGGDMDACAAGRARLADRAGKIYRQLRQKLLKASCSIKNDIRARKEAVFLPYKASMWDSLESVWRAAAEDPDCDAYVIPIPYYDRNPDGSLGEMHYEGGEYPEDVPVVWYGDYDFEARRPDDIFIHNPYDDCNRVTSVPPFFYSKNLKRFTDRLVYIPYFVLGEADPEDRAAVEGMRHFCTVPGVVHADRVVVQSEAMRRIYVDVMTEFMAGRPGYGRKYWEEKILGLGSPKLDRLRSGGKENLALPEEWRRVARKPDGGWKKVIFYNTTVTALLQYRERYLEKVRDVLETFYENREEAALWWRPHPLMKATVGSMRPELLGEYEDIVRRYREAGWGIYDDTADLDRAIAASDAYYGDASSVVQLYRGTGKPVMIQAVE